MKKALLMSWILTAFMLGCASSQFVVPPARAGTEGGKKWEYTIVSGAWIVPDAEDFNKFGSQGWELVAVDKNGSGFFKRPLP